MPSSLQIANHVIDQWDDWVPQDRVRKFTDENKELAAQLHNQMKALQKKPAGGKKGQGGRANGSDFSSARGSEERTASVAAQGGRGGQRRTRDYEIENVSPLFPYYHSDCPCVLPGAGLSWNPEYRLARRVLIVNLSLPTSTRTRDTGLRHFLFSRHLIFFNLARPFANTVLLQ
jgi:hypothetical protein